MKRMYSILAIVGLFLATGLSSPAFALTADDFFVKLVSSKADITFGEAIFEIQNPTLTSASLSKTNFGNTIVKGLSASKDLGVTYYIEQSVSKSKADLSCLLVANGTHVNSSTKYSEVCTKATINYVETSWQPLESGFTFSGLQTYRIKAVVKYEAKLGFNSRDWIPTFTFGGQTYSQNKWAWFNTSWNSRVNVTLNTARIWDLVEANESFFNITRSNANGTDIRVVECTSNTVSNYQPLTAFGGTHWWNNTNVSDWSAKGDNNWTLFRITNTSETCYSIYFNNTNATDASVEILNREDDFESYVIGATAKGFNSAVLGVCGGALPTVRTLNDGTKGYGNDTNLACAEYVANRNFTSAMTAVLEANNTPNSGTAEFIQGKLRPNSGSSYGIRIRDSPDPLDTQIFSVGGDGLLATGAYLNSASPFNLTFLLNGTNGTTIRYFVGFNTTSYATAVGDDFTEGDVFRNAFGIAGGRSRALRQFRLYALEILPYAAANLTISPVEYVAAANAAPTVTINFPTNATFLSNNLTINWTVTDDFNITMNCWRTLDGTETNLGATINGTTNTSFSGELSQAQHSVTITCQDQAASPVNGTASVTFSILHWKENFQNFETVVYETNTTTFNLTVQVAGNVQNITANFTYNNSIYNASQFKPNSTLFVFNSTFAIPLMDLNGTTQLFNWTYYITYFNSSNTTIQASNTTSQTVRWAYFINGTLSIPASALEGSSIIFSANISTILNIATLTQVNLSFNQTNTPMVQVNSSSGLKQYNLTVTMPLISSLSQNFVWNATLFVTFGGVTKTRLSATSPTQTVQQVNLVLCNSTQLRAYNFTYFNEELNEKMTSINLTANAYRFEASFNVFLNTPNDIGTKNFVFNLSSSNSYVICLQPDSASFKANADIRYLNETSFSTRFHFLRFNNITNSTTFLRLYLLDNSFSSPIRFIIREADGISPAGNVVVRAMRQYIENNSFETVAMGLTDSEGKAFTFLKMNTVFHKFRLERDGVVLREITQGVLGGSDVSLGLELIFSLNPQPLAEPFLYLTRITKLCTSNVTTSIVTCTFNDTSISATKFTLTVQKFGSLKWTQLCQQSVSAAAGSLTCNVSSSGNGTYYYWLFAQFPKTNLLVDSNSFTVGKTQLFGTNGLIAAAFLIMVLAFLGIFNPSVSIIMGVLGMIISVWIGLLDVSIGALVGIIIVAGIVVIKNRA